MLALSQPPKIVILGMMSRWPVAGVAWITRHYLEGFRRLGFDAYYVEAHGCTQTKHMKTADDDGEALAAAYIAAKMDHFGFTDRWAYHDVHLSGRCFGMRREQLETLYGSATLLINLHGATVPLPEHSATGRLIFLETDPVEVQIALGRGSTKIVEFLKAHCAYFTWGLNYGRSDCRLPVDSRFQFKHSPPVVVPDLWRNESSATANTFTTIGNWRQNYKEVVLNGEKYHWSKHLEFLKFLDLPRRVDQNFELALGTKSYNPDDVRLLEERGWAVRDAASVSADLELYRDYICSSRGEFTVAKDQNVRLRSGWFSERSAQYLAAGRPVITQDTGFGSFLPTGAGLFPFTTMDQILAAVDATASDYPRQRKAAVELAHSHFGYERVLGDLLKEVGL